MSDPGSPRQATTGAAPRRSVLAGLAAMLTTLLGDAGLGFSDAVAVGRKPAPRRRCPKRRRCGKRCCPTGRVCQGRRCVTRQPAPLPCPVDRSCNGACCPQGELCVTDGAIRRCVSAAGTCTVANSEPCNSPQGQCFCFQAFSGALRCGNSIRPLAPCTSDPTCTAAFGQDAFCTRTLNPVPGFEGFCSLPCLTTPA